MTSEEGKRFHYILTETAENDFREARRWSKSRWGKEPTRKYFSDIHKCAQNLARGLRRSPSKEPDMEVAELGVYPIREHYLVYVPIHGDCIAIVALIRQTRDLPTILNVNSFIIRRQLMVISSKFR